MHKQYQNSSSKYALFGGLAFTFIGGLLLSIIVFYEPQREENRARQTTSLAKLPNFTSIQLFNNSPLSHQDLSLPAVINLWASWCTACLYEHPVLINISRKGVTLYGINYRDNRTKAISWLNRHGNPFSLVAFDKAGNLGDKLDIYGLPETLLVDKQGNIVVRHRGWITQQVWEEKFLSLWEKM